MNYPLIKGFSVIGVRAGEYGRKNPDLGRENIDIINNLANEGKLKPYICKIFSFEDSLEALKYLKDRKLIGKVVISIS